MKILFSLFALIGMTVSCNSTRDAMDSSAKNLEPLSGTYVISQIGDDTAISEELTITFADSTNRVSGFAGCNSFFGTYRIDNKNISFKNIASTKKYCQKAINTIENEFISVLNSANTFSINKDIISLLENERLLLTANKTSALRGSNTSKIIYQALSKDTFEYVEISESEVIVSSDKNLMNMKNYKCNKDDWDALNRLKKEVNLETLEALEAPTGKRLFDGAPHATLTIKQGGKDFKTPSFDHGSPPEAIEALVNKVLSIKESVVKQ